MNKINKQELNDSQKKLYTMYNNNHALIDRHGTSSKVQQHSPMPHELTEVMSSIVHVSCLA